MFAKYLLYQLPGWSLVVVVLWLLRDAFNLSLGAAAALFGVWVVKDLVLFPFLRSAYETDSRTVIERLIGEQGTTIAHLAPEGYVRVRGELWRAEPAAGEEPIPAGRPVVVTGVRDSSLLVVPHRASDTG